MGTRKEEITTDIEKALNAYEYQKMVKANGQAKHAVVNCVNRIIQMVRGTEADLVGRPKDFPASKALEFLNEEIVRGNVEVMLLNTIDSSEDPVLADTLEGMQQLDIVAAGYRNQVYLGENTQRFYTLILNMNTDQFLSSAESDSNPLLRLPEKHKYQLVNSFMSLADERKRAHFLDAQLLTLQEIYDNHIPIIDWRESGLFSSPSFETKFWENFGVKK